jgi:hypothetical protein
MTAIIFSLTYIPMTFVAIYMFRELSPTFTFRIACIICIAGGWIRSFTNISNGFGVILFGYTVISLPYPIMLSSVTMICNVWLTDNERTMWTQILGLCVPIGTIVSFVLAGCVYRGQNYV